jgi:O-antigen/teichoic acid export membrane protein
MSSKVVSSLIWSTIESFSMQIVQFTVSIIIARLIDPNAYGVIVILNIFISISQVFLDGGFSNALIQKENCTEDDYSTVFSINLVSSFIVYLVLFFSAKSLSNFYNLPHLEILTKWISLSIIISAFSIVQRAKLTRDLDFKSQAKISFYSAIFSGIIGIILAYLNYGVWALLVNTLAFNLFTTLFMFYKSKWIPNIKFSSESFNSLFSFGSKLLFTNLISSIYNNSYSLIIGIKYSTKNLAFYNRAFTMALLPSMNLSNIVIKAIFPILCKIQNNKEELSITFLKFVRMTTFFVFPIMLFTSILSKPLINVILTNKWEESAKYLSILCIVFMWDPIYNINNKILSVCGRTDITLKLEVVKRIGGFIILFCTLPFGMMWLCKGLLIQISLEVILAIYCTSLVLPISYKTQFLNLMPIFIVNLLFALTIYLVTVFVKNDFYILTIATLLGGAAYTLYSYIFKINELNYVYFLTSKYLKKW